MISLMLIEVVIGGLIALQAFCCPGDITAFSMWVHSVSCRIWCTGKVKNTVNSRSSYLLKLNFVRMGESSYMCSELQKVKINTKQVPWQISKLSPLTKTVWSKAGKETSKWTLSWDHHVNHFTLVYYFSFHPKNKTKKLASWKKKIIWWHCYSSGSMVCSQSWKQ